MPPSLRPSEAEIQQTLLDGFLHSGWMVCHFRPARTSSGWRTPLEGHPGFPDLIAARDGQVLALEVKGPRGTLTAEQQLWQQHMGAGNIALLEHHVVGPDQLDQALATITTGRWTS